MLGFAQINNPKEAQQKLETLRADIENDLHFKSLHSLEPKQRKAGLYFHATYDHPEVRKEVFKILSDLDAKVHVAVRRKVELAQFAKKVKEDSGKKLKTNEIYDDLVTKIFKNMLHQGDENFITFAMLGRSERDKAFSKAIVEAQKDSRNITRKNLINQLLLLSKILQMI
jgi:hypothetical protein